ncbi:MAG: N-acetylmuramoyl-L-alanine amidase, partial [Anaerolineales bacterium]
MISETKPRRSHRWLFFLLLLFSLGAAPPPPELLSAEVRERIAADPNLPWPVVEVGVDGDEITLCLEVPSAALQDDGGEFVAEAVGQALLPLEWRTLHLLVHDPPTGRCRPWSDLLPQEEPQVTVQGPALPLRPASATSDFPRSLAGKTVYVSAGHGWQWNGSSWRTQRPPYQQIIEDHNNAEAVLQFLIPYLENAGATVVPVRERDRSVDRVLADNDNAAVYSDAGGWQTGGSPGYGGSYRFVQTTTGPATATAQWTLNVPRTARYALYAWVRSGANRPPDARYAIQHAGGTTEVRLDQRIRPETWRYLGTFPFYAGVATVTLDNHSADSGAYLIADALRLGGGFLDDLAGIDTTAPSPPDKPWWEVATFYYSQWMGMAAPYGDVTARPVFSRWYHAGVDEDAVYISWHSNGYNGDNSTIWGTVSYVHNGDGYPRTAGSLELQQAVHDEIIQDLRAGWDAGWRDLGKRQLNLGEVRLLWDSNPDNRMPGVLLELAYHDHVEDANALKDPRFNRLFARATYQGILHYFEQQEGVDLVEAPEPPTHLRVRNLGGGRVGVAWQPSPTDVLGLRGDPATGYRLYTSPDGFAWGEPLAVSGLETTVEGLAEEATLYVRVTAVNEGGESFPTETLGARVSDLAPLLIVSGYDKLNRYGLVEEVDPTEGYNLRMWLERINERDYVTHHGEAVPAVYAWDSASNEAVAAGFVDLADYRMVDWILGEESTEEDQTLNTDERLALTTFVEGGGALLISGSELAWNLASVDADFLGETLHLDYVADDAGTYDVTPVSGGPFADSGAFSFDAAEEYDADSPDVLAPRGDAEAALIYDGGIGGTAAVAWASGCSRTLVMGFPLETVRPEARAGVMAQALAFLDACVPPALDVRISSPVWNRGYRSTPPFTGTVTGAEPRRVEVQVQPLEDDDAWEELAWESGRWLTATGTLTWHYALPALAEGAYAVGARAVLTDLVSGDLVSG